MEPAVPSGEIEPLIEDTDILTVVDDYDGFFENLYDVPFVTVNRDLDEIEAEVYLVGVSDEIGRDRIMTACLVARKLGFRCYSRVFGDWGQVMLRYSDDPAKGTIWALENELDAWLQ